MITNSLSRDEIIGLINNVAKIAKSYEDEDCIEVVNMISNNFASAMARSEADREILLDKMMGV